ncbi:MAG: hypothetical protein JW797_12865 [Bradymonadales bacterium]|nr:hypothetical protein [Bradymonadales bacterium]
MAERDSRRKKRRPSRRPDTRSERKGGLTSLRSGFQNLVGTGKGSGKKKRSTGETFLWVLLLVAAVVLLVLSLVR